MVVVGPPGPLRMATLLAAAVRRASYGQACLPELDLARRVATQRLVRPLCDQLASAGVVKWATFSEILGAYPALEGTEGFALQEGDVIERLSDVRQIRPGQADPPPRRHWVPSQTAPGVTLQRLLHGCQVRRPLARELG
jgi:hypothetical protein